MRRLFWLGIGIVTGVAISRKVSQGARAATPAGIAGNLGDAMSELAGAIGSFGADVRAGMNERSDELADEVAQLTGINPTPRHALRAAEATLRASAPVPPARPARRTSGARARRADG